MIRKTSRRPIPRFAALTGGMILVLLFANCAKADPPRQAVSRQPSTVNHPAANRQPTEVPRNETNESTLRKIPDSLKLLLTMSVLSLAPALLMMTTCFVRFTIVTGLLRHAIGLPNLPPNQVLTSLCLFLTFLVMAPVWQDAYHRGIEPYFHPPAQGSQLSEYDAFRQTMVPLREFMGGQIEKTHNQDVVWSFLEYHQGLTSNEAASNQDVPRNYQEVPLSVLLPAYLVSELKTAFVIGLQIFLPFLVIDLVVSSVLAGTGMMMLPPVLVSLPFKLLLFVLIDGWYLTVGMLLESVRPFTG